MILALAVQPLVKLLGGSAVRSYGARVEGSEGYRNFPKGPKYRHSRVSMAGITMAYSFTLRLQGYK